MKYEQKLPMIGRLDKADFPEYSLSNIDIKIDTGAYTSAIHCHNIKEVELPKSTLLEFNLLDPTHPLYNGKKLISSNYNKKTIKSSTGHEEERFIIRTTIILFDEEVPIELSLTDRKDMKIPILIGRKWLKKRFLVDVSLSYLSHKLKTKSLTE